MKLVLQNLTKKFPNRRKGAPDKVAVNDFSFEIPDGSLGVNIHASIDGKVTSVDNGFIVIE